VIGTHMSTLSIGVNRFFLMALSASAPTATEWAKHMSALFDYRRLQGGDMSTVRLLLASDGGMPDTSMRVELQRLIEHAVPVAVVSDAPEVRGMVTAMRWSNPLTSVFAPTDAQKIVKHLGVSATDVRMLLLPALRALSSESGGSRALSGLLMDLSQGASSAGA
jgi:hypothetical protein